MGSVVRGEPVTNQGQGRPVISPPSRQNETVRPTVGFVWKPCGMDCPRPYYQRRRF